MLVDSTFSWLARNMPYAVSPEIRAQVRQQEGRLIKLTTGFAEYEKARIARVQARKIVITPPTFKGPTVTTYENIVNRMTEVIKVTETIREDVGGLEFPEVGLGLDLGGIFGGIFKLAPWLILGAIGIAFLGIFKK